MILNVKRKGEEKHLLSMDKISLAVTEEYEVLLCDSGDQGFLGNGRPPKPHVSATAGVVMSEVLQRSVLIATPR